MIADDKPTYEELERQIRALKKQNDFLDRYYRSVVDNSMDAILLTAPDGNVFFANQAACDLFQMTQQEIIDGGRMAILDEADDRLAEALEVREKTGKFVGELNYKKKDGTIFPGEVSSAIYKDADGQLFTSMIIRDITERKQAEHTVKKQQELLKDAEQLSNMGSWEWDIENDIAYWSDGLFSIFKRSPKDGAPKWAQQSGFYQKESYEKLSRAVEACVQNGTPYEVELQAIRSDGEIRTCIARGRAEKNSEGKITRLWGAFNDITERVKAEQALRQSEEKYRDLFESLIDEVHVWKLIRNKRGEIKGWALSDINPAALKAWKKTQKKVIGKTPNDIFGYDVHAEFLPVVEKIFTTGKSYRWERYFPPTKQYLSMDSIPFGDHFISTGRDISDIKQAEQALMESMEKLNQAQLIGKIGSYETDLTTGTWTGSAEFCHMFGFEYGKEYQVEDFQNIVHPDDYDETMRIFAESLQNNIDFKCQYRCINRKTKEVIYVNSLSRIEYSPDGKALRLFGTKQDITDRKEAERALQEALIDLELAQQIATIGNWQFDPEIGIPVWSEAVYTIYDRDPALGPPHIDEFKRIYDEEQYATFSAAFQRAVRAGIPYNIELRLKLPHNRVKWVQAICQPDEKKGDAGYFLRGTIQDITERKQLESEKDALITELELALARVKKLEGFLPICSYCKKIRDDQGDWQQIETYIHERSDAEFSHGICPECLKAHYPDFYTDKE